MALVELSTDLKDRLVRLALYFLIGFYVINLVSMGFMAYFMVISTHRVMWAKCFIICLILCTLSCILMNKLLKHLK